MTNNAHDNRAYDPVVISDDPVEVDESKHRFPSEYKGHFSSLMIPHETIRERVHALARLIKKDYQRGSRPVLVCVLKGACPFFQHLCDALQDLEQGYSIEFIRVSSYDGTESTGNVQVNSELDRKALEKRHLIIVEDIVDTGTTLSKLLPTIEHQVSPASIQVCTLLTKRVPKEQKVSAKYNGFSIPNHFIIGYGLDYNELYRDLRDIWVISKQGIDFDAGSII